MYILCLPYKEYVYVAIFQFRKVNISQYSPSYKYWITKGRVISLFQLPIYVKCLHLIYG